MANIAPDGPSESGATATRLTWAANSVGSANRVINTTGLLYYAGGGTGADLPYAGSITPGITRLNVGPDTVGDPVALGANDSRVIPTVSATVPSSPIDRQLWHYVDPSTGASWMFKYSASSSSGYKWELIGGGSAVITNLTVSTSGSLAQDTWTNFAAAAVSFTFPFAGEYTVETCFRGRVVTLGAQIMFGTTLTAGGSDIAPIDPAAAMFTCRGANDTFTTGRFNLFDVAASTSLRPRLKRIGTIASVVTVFDHVYRITPVRVG
jgi:hypothetical protein